MNFTSFTDLYDDVIVDSMMSTGLVEFYIAPYIQDNLAFYNGTSNKVSSTLHELQWLKIPCTNDTKELTDSLNVDNLVVWTASINFTTNNQSLLQHTLQDLMKQRVCFMVKTADNKVYLYGLDSGLILTNTTSTLSNETNQLTYTLRGDNLIHKLECDLSYLPA